MNSSKKIYRAFVHNLEKLPITVNNIKNQIFEWIEVVNMVKNTPVNNIELNKEQIDNINSRWKEYGYKIPLIWHRKYYGYSGKLDVDYFPEILYTTKLDGIMNPPSYAKILTDKNLIQFLYRQALDSCNFLKIPKIICGCSNGYYYIGNEPATKFEVIKFMCAAKEEFIIKPSVGESSGIGVEKICFSDDYEENKKFLNLYSNNFLVQECIKQNESYALLHKESVNTIRIMTYKLDGKIKHCPIIMRIGVGKSHLDNAHAGGMYIAVSDEGYLADFALQNFHEKLYKHPDSQIVFKGYKIPHMDKMIAAAKLLHQCLPMIGIVNWDLALDSEDKVELIEGNLTCGGLWLFQNAWGKGAFGEDTNKVIDIIRNKNVL